MLFSIIIPTYNRANILEETLLSVLDQTYANYEVLVVDDGSTDNTRETVEGFKNKKIRYFYKVNEERSIARNYGAAKATGDYLIFLDSDDKMDRSHLMSVYEFVKTKTPEPLFIFAGYQILNTDHSHLYSYGMTGFFDPRKLVYGNYLGCSSVIIQKELFKKHYFNTDKDLILFEDWELWLRVISENKLYCFPAKSIIMINHGGRSVLNYEASQFNDKILHFKSHILHSPNIITCSFLNKRIFLAGIYSYAALHIAMTKKNRAVAINYLFTGLLNNPLFVFRKRFLAIIKHLF
jgi:GalNAc5-diNAcBac-PP-undecaprenol beta-1,3-glucosyltransferase